MARPLGLGAAAAGGARQRGTVVILVVVAIGLLAFMGATYLQVSRVQRQEEIDPIENIDLALQSVIEEIAITLRGDIFDPATGNYFDSAAGIEPYDRPWTNAAGGTYDVFERDGTTVAGQATGGRFDDVWLASPLPVKVGGVWRWPQITTLTGGWYDSNGDGLVPARFVASGVQGDTPPDRRVGNGGALVDGQDYNFDIFGNANLIDADGDGMGDSRWERAPLALKDGTEFFMAVRIVDLASFLNANIATSLVDNAGNFDTSPLGTNAPRGIYPSELNLGGYVAAAGGGAAELFALLGSGRGIADATWAEREDFWEERGRYSERPVDGSSPFRFLSPISKVEDFGSSLTSSDATELAYRVGAQDFAQYTSVLEQNMPTFMADIPTTSSDIYGIQTTADADAHYEYGRVPRTRMTTLSKEALYAPLLPGDPNVTPDNVPAEQLTTRKLKLPLNDDDWDSEITVDNVATAADQEAINHPKEDERREPMERLAQEIEAVYRRNTPSPLPGGMANPGALGVQFAVNLQDYRDEDNLMTVQDVQRNDTDNTLPYEDVLLEASDYSGDEVLGFEAYPYITEVYVQRRYEITGTPVVNGSGNFDVTWESTDGGGATTSAGFAIELVNPFNYPISLDHIEIDVVVPTPPSGTPVPAVQIAPTAFTGTLLDVNTNGYVDLADLVSEARGGTVQRELAPNEAIILYRNPDDGVKVVDDTRITDGRRTSAAAANGQWESDMSMVHDGRDDFTYGVNGRVFTYVDLSAGEEWPKEAPYVTPPAVPDPTDGLTTAAPVTVRLRVPYGDAVNKLTYALAPSRAVPDTYTEEILATSVGVDPPPAGGEQSYYQHSDLGNGRRLNALAIDETEFLDQEQVPEYRILEPAGRGYVSRVGQPVKTDTPADPNYDKLGPGGNSTTTAGTTNGAAYPEQEIGWDSTDQLQEQWLLVNEPDSDLRAAGELLNLVIFGTPVGDTIPQHLSNVLTSLGGLPRADLNDLRLDPSPTATADRIVDDASQQWAWQVNHAQFLMSRLTTYSARLDGLDNNNDGTADDELEQTVSGRINFNGVEPDLLADILPLANGTWRSDIATDLNNMALNGGTQPSLERGIAHTWTGFVWPSPGFGGVAPLRRPEINEANDTQFSGTGSARIDFLLNELDAANPADGIADDREEATMILSMLDQIGTNRSDVFVAYILVHGYDSADFDNGGSGPVETARAIVLFDRSQLLTNDDPVRPTMLYRFP